MENDPSRARASLSRWRRACLQASPRPVALGTAALFTLAACLPSTEARPRAVIPRTPPDEIVVRTTGFAFHSGAKVDATWPAKADATRLALGASLAVLLDQEDAVVPTLTRQLGVTWPSDPLDFDVSLATDDAEDAPCAPKLPRVLALTPKGDPTVFFACVLDRAFTRLVEESALYRAIAAAHPPADDAKRLYECVARYAVASAVIAGSVGVSAARDRALDASLAASCSPAALEWVEREWVKRVREEETVDGFGARAGREAH
jgi:hypothetical protein